MFKWFRQRLLKGMIEDIIAKLPEPDLLKERLFDIFEEHKDEILEKVRQLIKDFVLKFLKEKLDTRTRSLPSSSEDLANLSSDTNSPST